MKVKTVLRQVFLFSLIVMFMASCNDDPAEEVAPLKDSDLPAQSDELKDLLSGLKTEVLETNADKDVIYGKSKTVNKSIDIIVGETVARSKKLFIARYIGIEKDYQLSLREEIRMVLDVLPAFKHVLCNASVEINARLKQEGINGKARKDRLAKALGEIMKGVEDVMPRRYISLLEKPRVRKEYNMLYASIRTRVQYDEIGAYYLEMVKHVSQYDYSGPFTILYYDTDFEQGHDTEILIAVDDFFEDVQFEFEGKSVTITPRVIKEATYVSYLYKGSTETLYIAWDYFINWAYGQGFNIDIPAREIYWLEDHDDYNNIVTELQTVIVE